MDLSSQIGWVSASEIFDLIATRTTAPDDQTTKSFIGEGYWNKVELPNLNHQDIVEILQWIHPSMSTSVRHCLVSAWMEVSASFRRSIQTLTKPTIYYGNAKIISQKEMVTFSHDVKRSYLCNG